MAMTASSAAALALGVMSACGSIPMLVVADDHKETVPLGKTYFGIDRYNPLDDFEEYEGGFDISNSDYLASAGFQGAPQYAIAILLVIIMLLMLLIKFMSAVCATCFGCCKGAFKPRQYNSTSIFITKVLLVVFSVAAAAGCFCVYAGGPKVMDNVEDITGIMVDAVYDLADDTNDINYALELAADAGVDGLTSTTSDLTDATGKVRDTVEENEQDIYDYMEQASLGFIILAGVLLFVILLAMTFTLLGWPKMLLFSVILGSILLILAWVFFGSTSIVVTVIDDLCTSMERYVEDPATSELDSLIPCVEEDVAIETMNDSRRAIKELIQEVNSALDMYSPESYICELYEEKALSIMCASPSTDYEMFVCGEEHNMDNLAGNAYPEAECPYPGATYTNYIGNFEYDYSYLLCDESSAPDGVTDMDAWCFTEGKISESQFMEYVDKAVAAQAVIDVMPQIEGLLQCTFVTDAFEEITDGPCDDMLDSMLLLWIGFVLNAVMYLCLWVIWIVAHSRIANPSFMMGSANEAGEMDKSPGVELAVQPVVAPEV